MIVSIMQPYFFPYIGYFSLIKHSDLFVLFDTPQFIRHGWIERNRILNQKGEPIYIKAPLIKHNRETAINDVKINNEEKWKEKILAQLVTYKKKAPHYWPTLKLINEIFSLEYESIAQFNFQSIKMVSNHLNINTPIKIYSEMNLKIDAVNEADEWALNICKAIGYNTYYNPIGGKSFFNPDKYQNENINLHFMENEAVEYKQLENKFEPFLSIIDVLMFNSINEVNVMLDKFKLS